MPQPFITFCVACSVAECAGKVLAKGLCAKHYQRHVKHGDPAITIGRAPRYPRQPIADYMREWRRANPDRWRRVATNAKARRRSRAEGVGVERFRRESIFVRDRGLCAYCGLGLDPANWHLDHVVPLSKGGAHTRANSAAACPSCNRKKGDMSAAEFRVEIGR